MRVFTKEELKKYDGSKGVAYVAYHGKVYDVSQSFLWKSGVHQVLHRAGCDLGLPPENRSTLNARLL